MKVRGRIDRDHSLLLAIMILALFLSFYPHLHYPFLLHVDEWFHVAVAKEIALGEKIDWYSGEEFSLWMERGWHFLLATIYFLFKPSVAQWIYVPAIFHLLAVLSVYYFVVKLFGRKEALISALLIALIPSNVTIGGPVFLIPVNLSLIFIPLALLFAFDEGSKLRNYAGLFAITTFLLYAHPPTAVILLLILSIYFVLNSFSKDVLAREKAKFILLVMFLSVLASIPNYLFYAQEKGLEVAKFDFWIYLRAIPYIYGVIPALFFIVGVYFLSRTRSKEVWALLLASMLLAVNIFIFTKFGVNWLIYYSRTFIPLFLLMSIIAGYGFGKLTELERPFKWIGKVLLILVLIATVFFSVNTHCETPYYHLIDEEDYENFLWIKENTAEDVTVLLCPWKARAFAPIAERRVFTVRPVCPSPKREHENERAWQFFNENCTNTSFLVENNISVVYAKLLVDLRVSVPVECRNEELVEVWNRTYVLKRLHS